MKDSRCKVCGRDVTGLPSAFKLGWWYCYEHWDKGVASTGASCDTYSPVRTRIYDASLNLLIDSDAPASGGQIEGDIVPKALLDNSYIIPRKVAKRIGLLDGFFRRINRSRW